MVNRQVRHLLICLLSLLAKIKQTLRYMHTHHTDWTGVETLQELNKRIIFYYMTYIYISSIIRTHQIE